MSGAGAAAAIHAAVRNQHKGEAKPAGPPEIGFGDYSNIQYIKREFILTSDGDATTYHNKLPYQPNVKDFYDSAPIQIFVAFLILANFVVSACYKYYDPAGDDDDMFKIFNPFEWFFGYAFLVELLVNMYGSYFVYFWWGDMWAWNWFDFVIVVISLMALYMTDLPGISVLRLFRAFRVVRLFKRVPEMRKMIESILKALPAMGYAFAALILLMGIWAIIGVEFLYDWPRPDSPKAGDYDPGYYFGDFWKAMLTLFQIMTFDSWASGIARDVIYDIPFFVVYFISFVFIGSIIMQNVLIAALLDVYLAGDTAETEQFKDPVQERFDDAKTFESSGTPRFTVGVEMTEAGNNSPPESPRGLRPSIGDKDDEVEVVEVIGRDEETMRNMLGKVLKRLDSMEDVMNDIASKYVTKNVI